MTTGITGVMADRRQASRLTRQALRRAGLLALLYIVLIFVLPPNQEVMKRHHLSAFDYKTLFLTLNLPVILAWLAAFLGYAKLREYANLVRNTPEGPHLSKLAIGLAWLAWGLPIRALVTLVLNGLSNEWSSLYSTAVIIGNYTRLIFPLVGFSVIGIASRGLMDMARVKFNFIASRVIALLFMGAGVLYCFMTFKHFNPSSLSSTDNPYFMPIWLVVLTIIVPFLYTWFVGLLASYEIILFSRNTNGVLYRRAFGMLVLGLLIVIASSIVLQYIRGIQPRADHLTLDFHATMVSIFRLINGGGFVLLALGAAKLKKIEEV